MNKHIKGYKYFLIEERHSEACKVIFFDLKRVRENGKIEHVTTYNEKESVYGHALIQGLKELKN